VLQLNPRSPSFFQQKKACRGSAVAEEGLQRQHGCTKAALATELLFKKFGYKKPASRFFHYNFFPSRTSEHRGFFEGMTLHSTAAQSVEQEAKQDQDVFWSSCRTNDSSATDKIEDADALATLNHSPGRVAGPPHEQLESVRGVRVHPMDSRSCCLERVPELLGLILYIDLSQREKEKNRERERERERERKTKKRGDNGRGSGRETDRRGDRGQRSATSGG